MSDKLPRMDYRQHRRARRLVHECCNYDGGNCLLLDDGEPCVCVQSISLSLMCRWFRVAVLPLDGEQSHDKLHCVPLPKYFSGQTNHPQSKPPTHFPCRHTPSSG